MNFLAHCFLSGKCEELLIGNFIADSVKGKNWDTFTPLTRKGILLHRAIDDFTDHHEIVKESKSLALGEVGRYAPVVIDLYYDHFLALDWSLYSSESLEVFTLWVYEVVNKYFEVLPEGIKTMLPYMVKDNWLLNYGRIPGIDKALRGISRRVKFPIKSEFNATTLMKDYDFYRAHFHQFFPHLIDFSKEVIKKEIN